MAKPKICSIPNCGKPANARGWCSGHYARFQRYGDPTVVVLKTPRGEPLSFLRETVLPYDGDDCLIWPYAKEVTGYGVMNKDGKLHRIHRIACEHANGPAPSPKHQAAHECGNGHLACVNPRHLSWKTRTENEHDKLIHGTSNRGGRHGMAKLTDDEAREILSLKGTMLQREVAEMFGVSKECVGGIQRRKSWAWL